MLGAAACLLVAALALVAPRHLVVLLTVWLAALGLVRRLLTQVGASSSADPLVLVGPFALALLALIALRMRTRRKHTPLAASVGVLSFLVALSALNPSQGSPTVGLSGLVFVLVPMLAFWVGRDLCDDTLLERVLGLTGLLAVAAAVYGLAQTFVGFPAWDRTWVATQGYASLSVGDTIRAFGSFSSAVEYAHYLAIGIIVWLAFWLRSRWLAVTVAAVALLLTALFYESSRGVIFGLLFTAGVVFAARRRFPLMLSLVAGLAATVLLVFAVSRLAPTHESPSGRTALAQHQLQGIANPLDPESSTLLVHLDLVGSGLESAITHPAGRGVGVVTRAGQKFGGSANQTESDPSNMAVALGIPGVIAYVVVFVLGFRTVYAVAAARRDPLATAALAVTAVTAFAWLSGGEYAIAPLPWLAMGWADGWLERRAISYAAAES